MANFDWTAWDASKAWHAGATAKDPASFYRGICAGKKKGDPSKQSSWALPYRYSPSSPPNAAGVRNALARINQTQGLTNKAEAQSKLERLMKQIQAAEKNKKSAADDAFTYRSANPSELPGGEWRRQSFPAELRGKFVTVSGGRKVYQVEGYATVYNRGYEMWDKAGKYTETIGGRALDVSLARSPDVAFLVNHSGVTMARTKSGSLLLRSDSTGLHIDASLNAARQDVKDLAAAIDDHDIDEMSFGFRIEDYQWNDEFTELELTALDINRGDVSAVNFGANPFTNIQARSASILRDLEEVDEVVALEAFTRIQERLDSLRAPVLDDEDEGNIPLTDLRSDPAPKPEPYNPLSVTEVKRRYESTTVDEWKRRYRALNS